MRGTRREETFTRYVILLLSVSLCELPFGFAKDRNFMSDSNLPFNTTTNVIEDSSPNMIDSQLLYWTSVLLDQYNVSVEDMDLRRKDIDEVWSTCHTSLAVNYSDPITQAAYLRPGQAIFSYALTQIIHENPALKALFHEKSLVGIVAVGAGPAPEMAGVLNYLSHYYLNSDHLTSPPMTRFLLVDSAANWLWAIDHLENIIRADLYKNNTNISITRPRFEKTFYPWDVSGEHQLALHNLPSVLTGDLFIFNFIFWTVLCSTQSSSASGLSMATDNLRKLVSSAPDGALFLFVDAAGTREDLVKFLEPSVFSETNSIKVADYIRNVTMPSGNFQRDAYLGKYFTDLSKPKITDRQCVLLYKKVQANPSLH